VGKKEYKLVASTRPPTKWPVEINNVIVYYAKDGWDLNRFKSTLKYKKLMALN